MKKIVLHLRITVDSIQSDALIAFLREARPFYEELPGITVRLFQKKDDPYSFIEVIEYATNHSYQLDQVRVSSDPKMQAYLDRWRTLLKEPVCTEVYEDVTDQLH